MNKGILPNGKTPLFTVIFYHYKLFSVKYFVYASIFSNNFLHIELYAQKLYTNIYQ